MTDADAAHAPQLEYGKEPPRHARRVARWLIAGAAVVAVAAAAVYREELAAPALRVHHQRRALAARPAPDAPAHVEFKIEPESGSRHFRNPTPWPHVRRFAPAKGYPPVFVGMRRSPGGAAERLVVVTMAGSFSVGRASAAPDEQRKPLWPQAFAPATVLSDAQPLGTPPIVSILLPKLRLNTIYAGQADPDDASRFIIRYRSGDEEGEIAGRLRADDGFDLEVLSGPARIEMGAVIKPMTLPK